MDGGAPEDPPDPPGYFESSHAEAFPHEDIPEEDLHALLPIGSLDSVDVPCAPNLREGAALPTLQRANPADSAISSSLDVDISQQILIAAGIVEVDSGEGLVGGELERDLKPAAVEPQSMLDKGMQCDANESNEGGFYESPYSELPAPDDPLHDEELGGAGGGVARMPEYDVNQPFPYSPTQDELANARTNRDRDAIFNWYDMLQKFVVFMYEHGHGEVSSKVGGKPVEGDLRKLCTWVQKQRQEYRKLNDPNVADDAKQKLRLTERRIKILKEVGFSWGDRHLSFDEYFDWLLKFKQEKGHCNVPTKSKGELKALGRWVQEIRLKYKRQKKRDNFERLESDDRVELTEEQMTRLNSIGFKWKMFDRNPNSAPGKKRKGDE